MTATEFGTWADGTSDLLYRGSMGYLLDGLPVGSYVVDLGGANGLSRSYLSEVTRGGGRSVTTVDIDPATSPDVVADIRTYQHRRTVPADTVLLRYVLHYLDDDEVRALFTHIAAWHAGNIVVIQFANAQLADKRRNCTDWPRRAFRTPAGLLALLCQVPPWHPGDRVNRLDYTVQPEFYAARLGVPGTSPHRETLLALSLSRREEP